MQHKHLPMLLGLGLLVACGKQESAPAPPPGQAYVATLPKPPPAPPKSQQEARRVLNDWLSAWNGHDTRQAASLLAEDVEYFDAGFAGIQHGREAALDKGMGTFLRGVPDLQIELRGEPIVSADAVAWEWTFTGTNTGTWGGIPATNQRIQLKGFSLMRLRGGKIVQLSSYYDTGTLNRQLGL